MRYDYDGCWLSEPMWIEMEFNANKKEKKIQKITFLLVLTSHKTNWDESALDSCYNFFFFLIKHDYMSTGHSSCLNEKKAEFI